MKAFDANWKSKDGTNLFVRGWEPDDRPKALVAFVHGLGEHISRYEHVGKAMTDAGYAFAGFDLRGHGKSGGIRGHSPSLEVAMQDIKEFLIFLTQRYRHTPRFLYGHSLGGLLTLAYTLKNKTGFKGVITTGAALRSQVHDQKIKVIMAKVLGSLIPTTLLPSGLDASILSRDPNVVTAYRNDPLVHDRMSLGFGKAGLNATDYVWQYAEQFAVPLLIMHGAADHNTYPHGSEDFAKLAAKSNDNVTFKLWDGLYHEVHNEPEKEHVINFMIEWLDRHL